MKPKVSRTLFRALLSSACALDQELLRCHSLRAGEYDSLRAAGASVLPRDLRGLLDVRRIPKDTASSSPSLAATSMKCPTGKTVHGNREWCKGEGTVREYVRVCARRVMEAAEAPGLGGLDACVGFAAMKHLNGRVDALRHLVFDTVSETERYGIRVDAQSQFQGADRNRYFFRYRVRIFNASPATVQLLSRAWTIRDLDGRVTSVQGPGVVGTFPTLAPNESYEYSSAVPLHTPVGTQSGHYVFVSLASAGHFEPQDQPQQLGGDYPLRQEQQPQWVQSTNAIGTSQAVILGSKSGSAVTAAKMLQVPIAPFSHRTPSLENDDVAQSPGSSLPSAASPVDSVTHWKDDDEFRKG